MSKVYNNGKCKKLPKYICHKTYGLGCLGCKMYNYYATGYQDGKKENQHKLKALEIIIAKNVNIKLVSMCSCVNDYNDIEDEELTYDEFMAVKEVLL